MTGKQAYNPRNANSNRRKKQREYWKRRGLPCGICGQPIDYTLGWVTDPLTGKRRMHPGAFVIDEIIPVSRYREGGYDSPEACAADLSNQRPVHYLCNARRGDGTHGEGVLHIVIGPPCSGKTTLVDNSRSPADVVIDLDALAHALGYEADHGASGTVYHVAQAARTAAIKEALYRSGTTWIIHTAPSDEQLEQYRQRGAVFHVLSPGMDVCLDRARADNRPNGTARAIREWYEKNATRFADNSGDDGDENRAREYRQPFEDW